MKKRQEFPLLKS